MREILESTAVSQPSSPGANHAMASRLKETEREIRNMLLKLSEVCVLIASKRHRD
jgi:hypothetical protein